MATIFCSMSGEGRGHATRMKSIVDLLKHEHRFVLYAPRDAYNFLAPLYNDVDDNVEVRRIPGMVFHYKNRRLDLTKSIYEGFKYLNTELGDTVDQLVDAIALEQPDLILTDFDPALPRAAVRCGVPFLSLTHQHFLLAYDLSILPWHLRFHAWTMSWFVRVHYSKQELTMVSGFFFPRLKPGYEQVVQLGPMIRPELREMRPHEGDFFLSYLRPRSRERAIEVVANAGLPIKIYGVGQRPAVGQSTFHEIDPIAFAEDLANCKAVICAAGNQLLGECLYLGKPVFAVPEKVHHEQLINAYFLRDMGCGDWVTLETVEIADLHNFVANLDQYRTHLRKTCQQIDGTFKAIEQIQGWLNEHQADSHQEKQ